MIVSRTKVDVIVPHRRGIADGIAAPERPFHPPLLCIKRVQFAIRRADVDRAIDNNGACVDRTAGLEFPARL